MSDVRTNLFASPVLLRDALEKLRESASEEDTPVTLTTEPGLRSTAFDAVREAMRDGDKIPAKIAVLDTDLRDLLPIFHTLARQAAIRKGHRCPSDHANRGARFVEAVTGERYDRPTLAFPVPAGWQPLMDALPAKNSRSEIGTLARCCILLGYRDAPRTLPSFEELAEATERMGAKKPRLRASQISNKYRRARRLMLDAVEPAARPALRARFAPLPRLWTHNTTHLGIEPETYAMLEDRGLDPDEMNAEQMLRALAPELMADYDYWAEEGTGALLSGVYRQLCLETLQRVAGWLIRGERGELLATIHLDEFFAVGVPLNAASSVNRRVAGRRARRGERAPTTTVSLLEFLVEREATASLRRSTVVGEDLPETNPDGKPWITAAVWTNCSRLWAMTEGVYSGFSTGDEDDVRRWGLIQARWGHLQKELSSRQIPAQFRPKAKNKALMIRTVSLPQLICVGVPLRRRELRNLRADWLTAIKKARDAGHSPDQHKAVREAAKRYFDQNAIPHLMLTLALDDGLRDKQYRRGRVGSSRNFRFEFTLDTRGEPDGIKALSTWWTGARADPACLKVTEKRDRLAKREGREVRWGYVDKVILWDFLSWWRPRSLLAAGKIASLDEYDLIRDLRLGKWALFTSPRNQTERAEHSRQDTSSLAGEELHRIVSKWLRPELPCWEVIQGNQDWRELWAMHITRLLTASYWGGVRNDWDIATYLTQDEESTLRKEYSEVAHEIKDRLGRDKTHWEHPEAYDPWMDRLYRDREVFDPTTDPDLPMPGGLRDRIEQWERDLLRSAKSRGTSIKVRAARPGQPAPSGSVR